MADINSSLPVTDTTDGALGATSPTSAQQIAGKDGSGNLQTPLIDAQRGIVIAGEGTAGSNVGGVLSVQGIASGTVLPSTDLADGPVTPGTVATKSILTGGQYNSTLPTLTTTQQSALQIDSRGRLITAPNSFTYFHPTFTTRLQSVTNSNSVNSTTLVATISGTTAGSLITVVATTQNGTLTCTDSASQTYSTANTITSGTHAEYIFYAANSTAGVTTVTITCNNSTALNIIVSEYTNVTVTTPLDKTASKSNASLTWDSSSTATTAQATELLIGSAFDIAKNSVTFGFGTNWTSVNSVQNGVGAGGGTSYQQEQYVSAVGAYTSTGTVSVADTVLAQIATFKMASTPVNFTYLNASTTIKASAGTLSNVTINSLGIVGATAIFYDGSVSAANKIATISLSTSIGALVYNLNFLTSLIMVVNSATADFTIVYS